MAWEVPLGVPWPAGRRLPVLSLWGASLFPQSPLRLPGGAVVFWTGMFGLALAFAIGVRFPDRSWCSACSSPVCCKCSLWPGSWSGRRRPGRPGCCC